jgi:aldehyde dehydrogenase (NAD+)
VNGFPTDRVLINGEWRKTGATIPLNNPSTGEHLAMVAHASPGDVDDAMKAARVALDESWGATTAVERGRILARMSALTLQRAEELAILEARDVGKPLRQARADVVALARYLEFYAGAADKVHGQTIPYQSGYTVMTLREPHGITGHIIPWNYPMQIIGRSVVAALAMGNAAVLKPSEEACLTALAFGRIAIDAGLPAGALSILPGLGETTGAALAGHKDLNHLSFTGSFLVGEIVQALAARAPAPVTLELGGKSPQILFDDADIDAALPFLLTSGIQNAGQTCSAASRILAHRSIYSELVDRLAAAYRGLRAGPALDDLDLGPLVSARQLATVGKFLKRGAADGFECAARGEIVADAPAGGHYCAPSLWIGGASDRELAREEIFGPVQVVLPFDSDEEAVAIANGAGYGLVAALWTRDGARQMRLARRLRAGQVFVNNYGAGGGVELPFGGVGKSGHGREKGFEALYGFSTVKTVAFRHD